VAHVAATGEEIAVPLAHTVSERAVAETPPAVRVRKLDGALSLEGECPTDNAEAAAICCDEVS